MESLDDKLTLLTRPGERTPRYAGMPAFDEVAHPGPAFPRLSRFFRPWRMIGKVALFGIPCWAAAIMLTLGGWLGDLLTRSPFGGAGSAPDPGIGLPTMLALTPFLLIGVWALLAGLKDMRDLPSNRNRLTDYEGALARADDADVLTPQDLRSENIREGLITLGHFEKLLDSIEREQASRLLRESLDESRRLVQRSVVDLVATERRIAEWSRRLGEDSAYTAKLLARRDRLVASYPGILDTCLQATDQALAHGVGAAGTPDDLEQSVQSLLNACQRALAEAEQFGPEIDEEELLLYAAKSRDRSTQTSPETSPQSTPERPDN